MCEWRRLIYQGCDYGDYYLISNRGEIKSAITGRIRKQYTMPKGYMVCSLSLGSRSAKKCIRVHKAVAETFIDNPENKPEVNHRDGDKSHNYADNLEWATAKENMQHAVTNGLFTPMPGCENGLAKLSEEDVVFIRKMYKPRDRQFGMRALARRFNVDHSTIHSDIACYTWNR